VGVGSTVLIVNNGAGLKNEEVPGVFSNQKSEIKNQK
jgi:hypothetical protein